jgi:hypothetical protein
MVNRSALLEILSRIGPRLGVGFEGFCWLTIANEFYWRVLRWLPREKYLSTDPRSSTFLQDRAAQSY